MDRYILIYNADTNAIIAKIETMKPTYPSLKSTSACEIFDTEAEMDSFIADNELIEVEDEKIN